MTSLLLERYKALLVENDYYGHYFARSAQTKDSLCDSQVRETMNVFIDLNCIACTCTSTCVPLVIALYCCTYIRLSVKAWTCKFNCETSLPFVKLFLLHACTIFCMLNLCTYTTLSRALWARISARMELVSHHSVQGWFKCEGAFNEEQCDLEHYINPYSSRSERIVFSTWNLDHM